MSYASLYLVFASKTLEILLTRIMFIVLIITSIFVIINFIFNIRIMKKKNFKKIIYRKYFVFSIIQIFFSVSLFILGIIIFGEDTNFYGSYYVGPQHAVLGGIILIVSLIQLTHYFIILKKQKNR